MTWSTAAAALAVAGALLVVPGLVVALVAGLRGLLAAALAPVLSVTVVATTAVAAQVLGMPLGAVTLAGGTAVALLAVAALRLVARHAGRDGPPTPSDGWAPLIAGLAGAAVGAVSIGVGLARGMGRADRWPQTFDAVFHLSAVDRLLRTGDGSSLTLGTLVSPDRAKAFYPAAWHDLVALVASWSGVDPPTAANAVALTAAAIAWPLGCVALTRVAIGPVPGVLATAGVLSAGITASPVLLTGYGTLWPNALATALLPACLALLADLLDLGPHAAVPRVVGWPLLAAAVVGLGLAHPNAVVSLLVVGAAALVVGWWARGGRARVISLSAAAVVAWVVLLSPAFEAQRGTSWPARQRLPQALGEWLALAPQRVPIPVVVAGLVLVGCVVAAVRPGLRWLLAVHLTGGALFVLVAGSDGPVSRMVSGAWWDDPFRLAALVGLAGVPLAAIGLDAISRWALARLPRAAGPAVVTALSTTAAAILVVASAVSGSVDTSRVVATWYRPDSMLTPTESAFVGTIGTVVPVGERVVGNPWDGAALSGPLAERQAVFPHLVGRWGTDRELLATSLSSVTTSTGVCAALDRLDVRYALVGPSGFWPDDSRRDLYVGLAVAGQPGFAQVAAAGRVSLWRITGCPAGDAVAG
ncbi:MAG TPA: DUF6541 family protein [Ornithinibacter sp.]|nr:DUF6541 family protein [Ornithinibacter sp.]